MAKVETQDLDDREVERVMVSAGNGERLTVKVMYHPPRDGSPGDIPPKVQDFTEGLKAQMEKALEP